MRVFFFTWNTFDLGVSSEPLGAEADWLVVGHKALGVDTAAARVHTVPGEDKISKQRDYQIFSHLCNFWCLQDFQLQRNKREQMFHPCNIMINIYYELDPNNLMTFFTLIVRMTDFTPNIEYNGRIYDTYKMNHWF